MLTTSKCSRKTASKRAAEYVSGEGVSTGFLEESMRHVFDQNSPAGEVGETGEQVIELIALAHHHAVGDDKGYEGSGFEAVGCRPQRY